MKNMMKIFAVAMMVCFATRALADTCTMRYIDKTIETEQGVECSVWIATRLIIDLGSNPSANIRICGWASTDAYSERKPFLDTRTVRVENIESITVDTGDGGEKNIYDLTGVVVIQQILSSEEFAGGEIKTFTVTVQE